MGKSKIQDNDDTTQEISQIEDDAKSTYEEQMKFVNCIANPLANRKLAKKLFKLIKKASKQKTFLRFSLKDVERAIRKGEKGIVVFAGNVTPIEVMCHLPAVCEEKGIPYIYTPSNVNLSSAMAVTRSSIMVLIKEHPEYKELYDECYSRVKSSSISVL